MIDLRKCPAFRLRSDFAGEIGFFARFNEPLTEEEFRDLCASEAREFSREHFLENNRRRCCYPNPSSTCIGGIILPGETGPVPYVTDGRSRYHPELPGLFTEVIEAARIAAGREPGPIPFTFPPPREVPERRFAIPPVMIFHDAGRSIAHVVPYSECDDLLYERNSKFWPRQGGTTFCGSSPGPASS